MYQNDRKWNAKQFSLFKLSKRNKFFYFLPFRRFLQLERLENFNWIQVLDFFHPRIVFAKIFSENEKKKNPRRRRSSVFPWELCVNYSSNLVNLEIFCTKMRTEKKDIDAVSFVFHFVFIYTIQVMMMALMINWNSIRLDSNQLASEECKK